MKLPLWTKNPRPKAKSRLAHASTADEDVARDPRRQRIAGGSAEPFRHTPFNLATCTLVEHASARAQAAFNAHLRAHSTRDAFWQHAPVADWMLDVLRHEWQWIAVVPEAPLRTFALECAVPLSGADAPGLTELKATVMGRIAGAATIEDLRGAQAGTQPLVSPGGVLELPRCSPHAAGALALWHTANPNPYEAAFWAAEFAALHDAFVVLRNAGELWNVPHVPADGWRAAYFARAHPQVQEEALRQARERQAAQLRKILPQPFAAATGVTSRPS